jgi:hypothetical protein
MDYAVDIRVGFVVDNRVGFGLGNCLGFEVSSLGKFVCLGGMEVGRLDPFFDVLGVSELSK